MFTNTNWITNGCKKVKNPAKIANVNDRFQGTIQENHDFQYQKNNADKIKALLEPNGIFMTEIYSAKRAGKAIFVVLFNNPHIMWQKYEGEGYGSGQNYIYYKEQKIHTTLFVDLTPTEILELFNGVDIQVFYQRRYN